MFLIAFPLLIIPVAIYNMVAFLTPGVSWTAQVTSVRMVSGVEWSISASDILLTLSLVLLFFETLKAARVSARSLIDHMLSMLVFVGALIEFLLISQAATSTFALLVVVCLIDVVAGYSVSIRTAQRDFAVERVDSAG